MTRLLLIGVGGFLGSVARYLLSGTVQTLLRSETFPFGTLAVNVLGCFVVGLVSYLADSRGAFTGDTRAFIVVGVLGGFTTFSAFGNETINLVRDAEPWLALSNVLAHGVIALGAVWAGRATAFAIWR
ncbi:MAG TPA: fluoride efflux transporter CrcB [Candidatus Binatus sp.]|jgi:fluoride exporter|nr:fluoride efflux transporter CrcB [Candidatus Binatus sp.]